MHGCIPACNDRAKDIVDGLAQPERMPERCLTQEWGLTVRRVDSAPAPFIDRSGMLGPCEQVLPIV